MAWMTEQLPALTALMTLSAENPTCPATWSMADLTEQTAVCNWLKSQLRLAASVFRSCALPLIADISRSLLWLSLICVRRESSCPWMAVFWRLPSPLPHILCANIIQTR